MKDPLIEIGSIVKVENAKSELESFLIVGKRMINPYSMNSWDYISVPYPRGLKRLFKANKQFDYDDYFYFNHVDIIEILHENKINNKDEDVESGL